MSFLRVLCEPLRLSFPPRGAPLRYLLPSVRMRRLPRSGVLSLSRCTSRSTFNCRLLTSSLSFPRLLCESLRTQRLCVIFSARSALSALFRLSTILPSCIPFGLYRYVYIYFIDNIMVTCKASTVGPGNEQRPARPLPAHGCLPPRQLFYNPLRPNSPYGDSLLGSQPPSQTT